jgi:outer membrane protein OmpA-like peptidoglycan-associated protein
MNKLSIPKALVALLMLALTSVGMANQQSGSGGATQDETRTTQVPIGTKTKVRGVILRRGDAGTFVMRDWMGLDLTVRLASTTKIEEKKSNPFRDSKKYSEAQLVRGLNVEVQGRGDATGALVAEKIKFSDDDLRVALTVDSTVVPIERRLGDTETRLGRAEQNAERLSGQLEELGEVANLARGGARAAQDTADAAVEGVNKTNDRISALDDYEIKNSTAVNFRVGSAVLSPEAKAMLDEIATQAKNERGYVIEVRGFASSDGSEALNRRLSQRRAEAVMRYLAETHDIPLRRIILPFGYGEAMPVADNSTLDGRKQNRRAEVKVLVSRGLGSPVTVNSRTVGTSRQP